MAKQKKVKIGEIEYTLQSVSPSWYYELNDKVGNTGSSKRDTAKYMDTMIRNCVISPTEVANGGIGYFDDRDDIKTPENIIKEIESFLRE